MSHPFDRLTPDLTLDAVERAGFIPDGSLLALNSYENRVLQIGIEDAPPIIGKFYRPDRWNDDTILEEHRFTLELVAAEIPVVPPLRNEQGETLQHHEGFRYALYPRQGGRAPELDNLDNLQWIGRFLGRIHSVGAATPFEHRPSIDIESMGRKPGAFLLESGFIPVELQRRYEELLKSLLEMVETAFTDCNTPWIRLHGDCHPGNILWTDTGPHFVDMDDCRMGPPVQDLWMLISGDRQEMSLQLSELLEGYRMFHSFDNSQISLIEPLRTLRIIHYAAWLAQRWDDPAFPLAFPWFNTHNYWLDHLATLEEQKELLKQPPLPVYP